MMMMIIVVVVVCRLHPSSDHIRMHKNRLRINDMSASDNGVFDCSAQNLAGAVNSTNSYLLSVPGMYVNLPFLRNPAITHCTLSVRLSIRLG